MTNIVLLSLDEVRPDHLGCSGYQGINTPNIDSIAEEGSFFKTCISSSELTPISHATILSGVYPAKHGVRDPYTSIQSKTLAQHLSDAGYSCAGFIGSGILSSVHGFAKGFELFDEPQEGKDVWKRFSYTDGDTGHQPVLIGNWWVERMLDWIEKNKDVPFFAFGYFYETHEGSEDYLLERGILKKGHLADNSYYDAKIEMADELVVGRILEKLRQLDIFDDTLFVLVSDHGTNLGEHMAAPLPWRPKKIYPQHTDMWDTDLKSVFMMRGPGITKKMTVADMVRTADITPTILDLLGVRVDDEFDGISLKNALSGEPVPEIPAYSEDLFQIRGPGAIQSIRTKKYKYMRNLSLMHESLYDVGADPLEQNPLLAPNKAQMELIHQWRSCLNSCLITCSGMKKTELSKPHQELIESRLRALGYII